MYIEFTSIIDSVVRLLNFDFTPLLSVLDTRMSRIDKLESYLQLPYNSTVAIVFIGMCIENFVFFKITTSLLTDLTTKQKAYILSIRTSYTLSVAGLLHNIDYITNATPKTNSDSMLHLAAYLVSDSVIGFYHYHDYLKSLSGYPHHIIYSVLIFISFIQGINTQFSLFLIEEFPTLLLSLGAFEPAFKNYRVFGAAFLSTRILFHSFLLYIFFHTSALISVFGTLSLALHTFWFAGLIKKLGNPSGKIRVTE